MVMAIVKSLKNVHGAILKKFLGGMGFQPKQSFNTNIRCFISEEPKTGDESLALASVLPVLLPRERASRTTRVLQDLST